ncbi:MAG: YkgJ family cysteine cluster protein [Hyphomicrobiales bacterium]|nr:YkgJ family cysteine cluster protein [Hyphomicrobiales bacterium]
MANSNDDYKKFITEKDPTVEPPPAEEDAEAAELARAEEDKRAAEADMELELFDGVRTSAENPVQPVRLTPSDSFCFSCHKGVSCWNECCHGTDITLTPLDILRLSRHLNIPAADFLARFTLPALHEGSGLPVAKLRMADEGPDRKPCVFLHDEDGCAVYEARPVSCRYYPLGMASVKMKGHEAVEDFHFLVKEPHCKGHEETKQQTVGQFREEQGVVGYDDINRGWLDILMKMASWKVMGGPWGKEPDQRSKKMFFMVTTDAQQFRRFVFETRFLDTYAIDAETVEQLKTDDEALLQLGFDWMKSIFFNESTINMKEDVLKGAIAKARNDLGAG